MINNFLSKQGVGANYPTSGNQYHNSFLGLQKQINDLFGNSFEDRTRSQESDQKSDRFVPKFEVCETDKAIGISAELPGIEKKDINISILNNILSVEGEKRIEGKKEEKNYYLQERSYGTFKRSFSLPEGLARDKVVAEFKNGVLTINMPKTDNARKKVIKIEVNK